MMEEDSSDQQSPDGGGRVAGSNQSDIHVPSYSQQLPQCMLRSTSASSVQTNANPQFRERDTIQPPQLAPEFEPQTPPTLSVSTSSGCESVLSRARPESSPFFGRPSLPLKTSSSSFARKGSKDSSSVVTSPAPSPYKAQAVISKDSRSVSSSAATQERPRLFPQPRSASDSEGSKATPRKVVRPDDWWQKGKTPIDQAPTLPDKSPLRAFLSDLPPCPPLIRPRKHCAKRSELEDLLEQEALRLELSPPPLRISRIPAESLTSPKADDTLPKTLAPSEAQARLGEPNEVSTLAQEVILRKVLSTESFTEATKPDLAEKVEEAEDSWKRRHRKMTLEMLEGSPVLPEHKEVAELGSPFRFESESVESKMDSLHPNSAAALTAHRREAIRLAKSQERAVAERCKRSNQEPPGYAFDELIGKGSFGRVYKGRQNTTSKIVAIKVLDIDDADFQAYGEQKDEQIKDFNREIRILRQAQESGAENLNQMIEALPVHSQLWLICEYCPGGSVKTLMRATNDRLAEMYIVVVARELAKALKGLHAAGIIHRDVKAANVLIHEEGRLELCDFGVANVLDTRTDKRRTFIGTLHWMPPELWSEKPEYSDEVDVWEYGCTIYECALGRPPNSDLRERQQLKTRMRRLKQSIALPEKENFSDGLRSLVTFALSPEVTSRPSMREVLGHEFLASTDETHPTSGLTELVKNYYAWLFSGGQRVSLFMPGGAAAAATEDPDAAIPANDEWNFSMTQDFERRVSTILEIPDLSELSAADLEGEETPKQPKVTNLSPPGSMTAAQKANFEARVDRGAADLSNLFADWGPAYEFKTKTDFIPIPEPQPRRTSDLPFRAMAEDRPSSIASNVIDLGDFDEADYAVAAPRTDDNIQTAYADTPRKEQTIRLADASTLRQKRADSKGPRESHSLTARRASSADDAAGRDTVTDSFDFAAAQQDWTVKDKNKALELQEAAEITSSKPGHATMDWSFASAMQDASSAPPTMEEHPTIPTVSQDEPGPEALAPSNAKARMRATLDWSFSDALSELNATSTGDADSSLTQHSPPTTRTPKRPAALHRQMTMPVTHADFEEVEHDHVPRPATALSEAYSESSQSSADIDPFGLEQRDEEYPGPGMMDESGISGFYASRGRTLGEATAHGGNMPMAYASGNTGGGGASGAYPFGRPPRIADPGFPGPAAPEIPTGAMHVHNHTHNRSVGSGSSTNASGGGGSHTRPMVEVPETAPPSLAALAGDASNEEVEAELMRLLEGMQGTLAAAGTVVGGLEVRTASKRGRRGDSEWEDEE